MKKLKFQMEDTQWVSEDAAQTEETFESLQKKIQWCLKNKYFFKFHNILINPEKILYIEELKSED